VLAVALLSVWIISRPERGTTGAVSTKFRLLGPNDKIDVDGFDAPNVLVYVAYSDRVIEGSPKNSISSVPIMSWPEP
jgi:CreA protein